MSLDRYADTLADIEPDEGGLESAELVVTDDVLVKLFVLGPGATLEPHEHADSTNVFHVLEGEATVVQDGKRERIAAPGVVKHDRGVAHGVDNETDERVVLTASLCPLPS
ncbi:cupin domain-containing protein [Salinadaptatus halalkaliphilus]|uniref:Cupin domain-containing protein n=1 Tax=Salinadaptatus halalkaliphilus TaxID=2419781 RepID=A0A4S3TLD5_9EURY|nr:cupin domain-containing protein [Salinadaptatus halalkaliphilus]THE64972.1 cupin domain-containing protein [Salinadaptatus halalkaliphilus]